VTYSSQKKGIAGGPRRKEKTKNYVRKGSEGGEETVETTVDPNKQMLGYMEVHKKAALVIRKKAKRKNKKPERAGRIR